MIFLTSFYYLFIITFTSYSNEQKIFIIKEEFGEKRENIR